MSQLADDTRRNRRTAKRILAVGLPLVVIAATGIGYANWTQTATGSGTATAKSAVASTVTGVAATADLYPGSTGGVVSFSVNNPNPYPVTFTSMTPGAITVDAAHSAGCASTNITVASATLTLNVAAGGSGTAAPAVASMISTAANGCQGATFTVALTLAGASS